MAESHSITAYAADLRLGHCELDIVEIAALRNRGPDLTQAAAASGLSLPPPGQSLSAGARLVLSVRPERWLILSPAARIGPATARWHRVCAGMAIAVELSSAFAAFFLTGSACRELLARGCRLDLDPRAFPVGSAAATLVAQVSMIVAALPSGILILTPSTTARHVWEWLASAGRPFALVPMDKPTVEILSGEVLS